MKMDKQHDGYSIDPISESTNIPTGTTRKQWLMAILVNVTLLGNGMQIGWIASMAKTLQSEESPAGAPLSAYDISWLASCPSLAAMISIPAFMFAVDRAGRKPCIAVCAFLYLGSWVVKVSFGNMTGLVIARILGGIAVAGCFYTVPMYVKEISQDDVRGVLGMILNLARSSGLLIMYIMGAYMDYYSVLWTVIAMAVLNSATILLAPESPFFYVKIGKPEAAASTIAYLRELTVADKVVNNAMDAIRAEDEKFRSIPDISFIGIFKQKAWRKGFFYMVLVMIAHGLNGGFSIMNYAPTILVQSGVTVSPELQSLSIPVIMIVGCLVSMFLIERLGRKLLLIGAFLLTVFAFLSLAAIVMIQNDGGHVPSWITVVVLLIPVYTYAASIAPVPYVIMAEMFNFQIRAKVLGCLAMLGWTVSFTQTLVFGPVTEEYGAHVTFILCAAVVNLFGAVVVLILPETKAKSVQQIELELERK